MGSGKGMSPPPPTVPNRWGPPPGRDHRPPLSDCSALFDLVPFLPVRNPPPFSKPPPNYFPNALKCCRVVFTFCLYKEPPLNDMSGLFPINGKSGWLTRIVALSLAVPPLSTMNRPHLICRSIPRRPSVLFSMFGTWSRYSNLLPSRYSFFLFLAPFFSVVCFLHDQQSIDFLIYASYYGLLIFPQAGLFIFKLEKTFPVKFMSLSGISAWAHKYQFQSSFGTLLFVGTPNGGGNLFLNAKYQVEPQPGQINCVHLLRPPLLLGDLFCTVPGNFPKRRSSVSPG